MTATHIFGYLLVTLSAALSAAHWQQWRRCRLTETERYKVAQLLRRTQASALIGVVGAGMIISDRIPRTPIAVSVYLFSLLAATCLILWLGVADWWAVRRRGRQEAHEKVADELREHLADFKHTDSDP